MCIYIDIQAQRGPRGNDVTLLLNTFKYENLPAEAAGTLQPLHPAFVIVQSEWKMRQKCELHKRGALVSSEAAWCEWINHLQLAIPNTYVWANGRTPSARGEKLMCWWATSQIFRGPSAVPQAVPLPACQPSRHLVCFSISVSFCPSLSRSVESWLRPREMKIK